MAPAAELTVAAIATIRKHPKAQRCSNKTQPTRGSYSRRPAACTHGCKNQTHPSPKALPGPKSRVKHARHAVCWAPSAHQPCDGIASYLKQGGRGGRAGGEGGAHKLELNTEAAAAAAASAAAAPARERRRRHHTTTTTTTTSIITENTDTYSQSAHRIQQSSIGCMSPSSNSPPTMKLAEPG